MRTKLCVIDEQEIYQTLFKMALFSSYDIEIMLESPVPDVIWHTLSRHNPDILMVSTKNADGSFCDTIGEIRQQKPRLGVVILLTTGEYAEIEQIRKLASVKGGGLALFQKHSIDSIEQLTDILNGVSRGQLVLDPALSSLLLSRKSECPILRQMTNREQEILSLLANGYTNAAIARTLFIDLKTVEHHINNMYGKLKSFMDFEEKHPRVHAARLYLEAVGELTAATSAKAN